MNIIVDNEFKQLENEIYQCLYEQDICNIEDCKYFPKCEVCKFYIQLIKERFPLLEVYLWN